MALNLFNIFNKNKKGDQDPNKSPDPVVPGSENKSPAEVLAEGMTNVRDIISPSAIEVDFDHLRVGNTYYRTIFVSGYPRFVGANWLSPVINFEHSLDISMFYYPVKSKMILDDLRRKITELEATMMQAKEKGKVTDPVVAAALDDANALQEQLVKGVEKYFQFSFYITIPGETLEELDNTTSKLESTLGSLLLISKVATLQMEDAFQSSIPAGMDKLMITRNMDTTSLATTFPFTSSDLTMDEGIMYGINRHNGSLVIFDRFSMENANTVVFAKSGAGKSYFVKLEALRLLVFGTEVMIIDPEEEYRALCDAVGGNYIDFSANSPSVINPFDLSGIAVEGENELGIKILSLMTLFKLMLNGMNQTEEAIMDRALIETYRLKGITTDPESQMANEPPVIEDLYKVLMGGNEPESRNLAERLEKFIKGSMAGIFDKQSTIDINNKMTVFSTKNLEDSLRPIAFYIILDFVWTRIRRDLRRRILIVEEAWYLMSNEDSAKFIYGIAKRARKYYLGLTTITQDVDDFLGTDYGKAIVSNSSIHVLFKQHPSAIERVANVFYLSEGEKRLLLAAGVGEGLFFAGSNHVSIKVMASEEEHRLITTNPEEILKLREQGYIKTPKGTGPRGSRTGLEVGQAPPTGKPAQSAPVIESATGETGTVQQQSQSTQQPTQQTGPASNVNSTALKTERTEGGTTIEYFGSGAGTDETLDGTSKEKPKPTASPGDEVDQSPNADEIMESVRDNTPIADFSAEKTDNRPNVSNTVGHTMRKMPSSTSNSIPLKTKESAPASSENPSADSKIQKALEENPPSNENQPKNPTGLTSN